MIPPAVQLASVVSLFFTNHEKFFSHMSVKVDVTALQRGETETSAVVDLVGALTSPLAQEATSRFTKMQNTVTELRAGTRKLVRELTDAKQKLNDETEAQVSALERDSLCNGLGRDRPSNICHTIADLDRKHPGRENSRASSGPKRLRRRLTRWSMSPNLPKANALIKTWPTAARSASPSRTPDVAR